MGILIRQSLLALSFLIAISFPLLSAHAEQKLQLYEQKIKAGLVYNFLKYTDWPEGDKAEGRLRICLYGEDPFDGYLTPLQGRTAQQAVIDIAIIKRISEADNCNMVVIGQSRADDIPALLGFLKGKHVLTVSDISRFARQGGMVELTKEGSKIGLYINKDAVSRAGLDIQNQMLKLAKLVSG
jgi:hypothetical protein